MVELYYKLIIANRKSFSQVPLSLQPSVHELLLSNGYNDDGTKIIQ